MNLLMVLFDTYWFARRVKFELYSGYNRFISFIETIDHISYYSKSANKKFNKQTGVAQSYNAIALVPGHGFVDCNFSDAMQQQ